MAELKAPPAPIPILEGTVFIKNPLGAIHDMDSREAREQPVLEQAQKGNNGWRMASDEEIAAYCERHNIVPPGKAKAPKAAEATEEPRSATASEERLATATAEAEEPVKRGPGRPPKG